MSKKVKIHISLATEIYEKGKEEAHQRPYFPSDGAGCGGMLRGGSFAAAFGFGCGFGSGLSAAFCSGSVFSAGTVSFGSHRFSPQRIILRTMVAIPTTKQ